MAQTLKEDTAVPAGSSPNSGKTPSDATTRTQPVALEIPVTINGARTVAGSDKREPFSEATQTVLVFGHGAVVRVNASLAPGQLVFLTNEKTKKEVVCQVIKSKTGGRGAGYVELQFTEASPNFWGLRMAGPAVPTVPPAPAHRPAVPDLTVPSAPAKSGTTVDAILPKPVTVIPKPVMPVVLEPAPAPSKPELTPAPPTPISTVASPLPAPTGPTPLISVPPPSPFSTIPEPPPAQAAPPPVQNSFPVPDRPAPPPPSPLSNYAKEIEALFAAPRSKALPTPEPKPVSAPSDASTEQLKLETTRLQSQLSSLLFTETSKTSPAPPASNPAAPAPDLATKIFEIGHEDTKPPVTVPNRSESKYVSPPPSPRTPSFSPEDEEVKIPSWLAPLSQNSPSMTAEPVPAEAAVEVPAQPEESTEPVASQTSQEPEVAVFGGQLLGEAVPESVPASSSSLKKGLIFGLAAGLLVIATSIYYFRPDLLGMSRVVSAKPVAVSTSAPPASATAPTAPASVVDNKASNSAASNAVSSPALASSSSIASLPSPSPALVQPSKNSSPAPSPAAPASATPVPPVESRTSKTAVRNAPSPEPPKKPPLGAIHLAAPVISHTPHAQEDNATLPSIDTHANSGADTLAAVGGSRSNQPSAPVPVGGEVTSAQLIKSVPPIYPPMAKVQHVYGNVQLDALIDASGNVAEIKVLSGPALLQRAALDAVKQWKYKPAILDGQPTPMHLTVTVQFRAQ